MHLYSDSTFTVHVRPDYDLKIFVIHSFPKPSHFILPWDQNLWDQEYLETYLVLECISFYTFLGSSSLSAAVPEPSNSRLHQCLSGSSLNTVFTTHVLIY